MADSKIVNLLDAKAKASGVSADLLTVLDQINERFGIRIEASDERLGLFKTLFPALNEAAKQHHRFELSGDDTKHQAYFDKGIEVGKAQMMTDVIICLLEQEGLIERDQ